MLKYAKYLFVLIYIFCIFIIGYEALKDSSDSSNISNDVAEIVGGAVDQIGGVVDQIGSAIGGSQNNNNGNTETPGGNTETPGGSIETPGVNNDPSNGNTQPEGNIKEPDNSNDYKEEEPHEHVFINANCECGEKDPNFITRYNFDIVKFRYFVRKLVGHFGAFVILGVFASLTYYCFINRSKLLALSITIAAGLVVACGSELLQFIPNGRCPAFKDVLIDMAGYMCSTIILGLILYLPDFIKRIINNKKVESN